MTIVGYSDVAPEVGVFEFDSSQEDIEITG